MRRNCEICGLHMTCLVKLVDFTQGIFKRDRILVSVWKVKIECAILWDPGFERLVKYCSKLSWAKTARLPGYTLCNQK